MVAAEVAALHVFATWMPPGSLSTCSGWMRRVPEARAQIDQQLHDLVQPATASGMDVPQAIREGDPVTEILAHAASVTPDLIVLSMHGRSGFDRLSSASSRKRFCARPPALCWWCPHRARRRHSPSPGIGASSARRTSQIVRERR